MSAQPLQYIVINEIYENQRLDNYLIRCLKGVPKSRIYRAIRAGEVRVNQKRIDAKYRLQAGDKLRIPPLKTAEQLPTAKPATEFAEFLISRILYEDDNLLVMNKPAGLPVHGGSGLNGGLIELLRQILNYPYLELAHRLDRETSGCLMIAKKAPMLKRLHELMRGQQIKKCYYALVLGAWPAAKAHITLPLQKYRRISGERLVTVNEQGKPSETLIRPVRYYPKSTLIEATLLTGRTHQIRVHCAQSGHPIAGDDKYGDKSFNNFMRKRGLKRMFLHAFSLEFTLPTYKETIKISAELQEDMHKLLADLE